MAHKNRLLPDEEVLLVVNNTPAGESETRFAAKIFGCHEETMRKRLLRIRDPKAFQLRYVRPNISRKRPVTPATSQIVLALKITDGNADASARILGCSKTPVRNYILAERAAGRSCGNYRNRGVQISYTIPSNARCNPDWIPSPAVQADMERVLAAPEIDHR